MTDSDALAEGTLLGAGDVWAWLGEAVAAAVIGAVALFLLTRIGWRLEWHRAGGRRLVQPAPDVPYEGLPGIKSRVRTIGRSMRRNRRICVVGPPGAGKSSAMYGFYRTKGKRFRRRLWIGFGEGGLNREDVRVAAHLLGADVPEGALPEALAAHFLEAFSRKRQCLLVLDGANDAGAAMAVIPSRLRRSSRVALTSVSREFEALGIQTVELPELQREDCVRYLRELAYRDQDADAIAQLVDGVGRFPFAVRQFGLMLSSPIAHASGLARRLADEGAAAVFQEASSVEQHPSVLESFVSTLHTATSRADAAEELLAVVGALSSDPIPIQILDRAVGLGRPRFTAALEALRNQSILVVRRSGDAGEQSLITVHPLHLALAREVLVPEPDMLRRLLSVLAAEMPARAWDPQEWAKVESLRAHASAVLTALDPRSVTDLRNRRELHRALGRYAWATGSYREAAEGFASATIQSEALGAEENSSDRAARASITNDRGITASSLGMPREALRYHEHALALWTELGPAHRENVLFARTGRACVMRDFGLAEEAVADLESELKSRGQRWSVPSNEEDLWALAALSTSMAEVGRLGEALSLGEEVLAVRLAWYGRFHVDTARSYYALARLRRYNREFSLSHDSAVECVSIRKRILGALHPLTRKAWLASAAASFGMGRTRRSRTDFRASHPAASGSLGPADHAKFVYWGAHICPDDQSYSVAHARQLAVEAYGADAPVIATYVPLSNPDGVAESRVL